ncbi:hypothetical protein [uncultured Nostoc sp.]|uniref:hypothetical protein n=1 Tax=uncultured Nostoc sp. TaxID=340711 RepID=UPI0035CC881A
MRDDFSPITKQILARRVGYRCSNPNCRKPTSGPQEDVGKAINIGVAAHITAASASGLRFDPNISSEERKSQSNGIWLCQNCGKLIDSDEKRYSVSLLQRWKSLSEQAALLDLEMDSTFNGLRQSNSASQDFKNGSGTQVNIGNTTIGHKTVYNQHASEFVYEVKKENGVQIKTTYRINPVTGARVIVGQELA